MASGCWRSSWIVRSRLGTASSEASTDEMCGAKNMERETGADAGTEPLRSLRVLDCDVRLARPKP